MAYNTEQKQALLDFLREHREESFTIEQLASHPQIAAHAGKSTVYRLVAQLLKEGSLQKHPCQDARRYMYQYIGPGSCHFHLHMKCLSCGRLVHIPEEISREMLSFLANKEDFQVDTVRTVLYGTCRSCLKAGGKPMPPSGVH